MWQAGLRKTGDSLGEEGALSSSFTITALKPFGICVKP